MKRTIRGIAAMVLSLCLSGCAVPTGTTPSTTTKATTTAATTTTTSVSASAADTSVTAQTTTVSSATETTVTSGTATTSTATHGTTTTSGSSAASSADSSATVHITTTTKSTTTTTTTTKSSTPSVTQTGEFRGVWVTYMEVRRLLLDNPTPQKAAAAIDAMMADIASLRLNAVIWMVRGHSDAYYDSALFTPHSSASPLIKAGFDPLEYAVASAHRNGLELHAWVNPYRIGTNKTFARCDDYFKYNGNYYYVPTSTAARKLILDGVRELVNGYAIDGVHFDDYFYPSGSVKQTTVASFETADYTAYKQQAGASAMSVADWRRNAVNTLISSAYSAVHAKQGCVFGVAPFHNTQTTYGSMYADTKLWISKKGYVDYMCPQAYFGFEHGSDPFDEVVEMWRGYPRHSSVQLYFGLGLYKIGTAPDRYAHTTAGRNEWKNNSDIMKREVQYLRARTDVGGMIFYSYRYFDPAYPRDLTPFTENGATVTPTYDKTVAQKEINALKAIL